MENRPSPAPTTNRACPSKRSSNKDPKDFAEFYRVHAPGLRRRANRLTASRAEAEDLVQETFLRALQVFSRFRPDNGMAWLCTIMTRLFVDGCRKRKHVSSRELADDHELAAPEHEPEAWWLSLTMDDVKEALAELPEDWQGIFASAVLEGKSYKEISDQEGIGCSNVGSRLHRTRAKLRAVLVQKKESIEGVPNGDEESECLS